MKRFFLLAGAALGLALLLAGCSPRTVEPAVPTPGPAATAAPAAPTPAKPAFLTAALAGDRLPEEYLEFQEEPTGYEVQVIFATDRPVTDFRFLALTPREAGEALAWDTETLYTLEVFSPQVPLVVTTTFAGDLPGRGISYTDTDGTLRQYALSLSGKDGSLLLEEFTG